MKPILIVTLLTLSFLLQGSAVVAFSGTAVLYPVADGYPDSKYPDSAYGKTSFLYVGNSYDHVQDIWGSERIYIRFDLGGLDTGRIISKAILHLWQYYAPATNQTYETHRVLGSWDEQTLSWNHQPSWAKDKTSEAVAPPQAEVAVEWDITKDVQAWYEGLSPNYGVMIKAAREEQVKGASSGFWSREYPVGSHEEWRPQLIVSMQARPNTFYTATVGVNGIPSALRVDVSVDGQPYQVIGGNESVNIVFDLRTSHIISVSDVVNGSAGVKYTCNNSRVEVSSASSHVFSYAAEYFVSITTSPGGIFETPRVGWYAPGTIISVKRTGSDVIYVADGTRLVFEGWYTNSERISSEPATMVVSEPLALEARYRTEYYLNVTSPFGVTSGSGWHEKDSAVSFSVDADQVPAPGILGIFGLKKSLKGWVGSHDFLGLPSEPRGSVVLREPTSITAVWQDDWSTSLLYVGLVAVVMAIAIAAVVLRRQKQQTHPSLRLARRGSVAESFMFAVVARSCSLRPQPSMP
jgi:hypothetical protein